MPVELGQARVLLPPLAKAEDSPFSEPDAAAPGEPLSPETARQRFRQFPYQVMSGPQETLRQLRKLCFQWLQPEVHTKEEILEILMLEQFLTILPGEIQMWVRKQCPGSGEEAVTLVESLKGDPWRLWQWVSGGSVFRSVCEAQGSSGVLSLSWHQICGQPVLQFPANGGPSVPFRSDTDYLALAQSPQAASQICQSQVTRAAHTYYRLAINLEVPTILSLDNLLEWLIELRKTLCLRLPAYYEGCSSRNNQMQETEVAQNCRARSTPSTNIVQLRGSPNPILEGFFMEILLLNRWPVVIENFQPLSLSQRLRGVGWGHAESSNPLIT